MGIYFIFCFITLKQWHAVTLSEKTVQKLSLGLYLFKRYTFVSKGYILVP